MEVVLLFVILLHVTQPALAVEVDEGVASVVLPCQAPPGTATSVLWSRSDLSPSTVHLRRNKDELENQNPRFKNRTSMQSDALQTGDISLTLTRPLLFDSGTYICTVRGGGPTGVTEVTLMVTSRKERDLQTQVTAVSAAFGVFVVLVAASAGVAYRSGYLRFNKNSGPEDNP